MRHTKARNIIERAFAVLKMRWGILRSQSFYPIKVQIRIISACFLLHNYVRGEMSVDPLETLIEGWTDGHGVDEDSNDVPYVDFVEATNDWSNFRDQLATTLWNQV